MKKKKQKRLAMLEIIDLLDTECAKCENKDDSKKCTEIKCPILERLNLLGKHSSKDESAIEEVVIAKPTLTIEKYIELKHEGLSDSKVSAEVGMTATQVATWKRKYRVTNDMWQREELSEEIFETQLNQYVDLLNQNLYKKEIAIKMGMTENMLYSWIRRNKVKEKMRKIYGYYR